MNHNLDVNKIKYLNNCTNFSIGPSSCIPTPKPTPKPTPEPKPTPPPERLTCISYYPPPTPNITYCHDFSLI